MTLPLLSPDAGMRDARGSERPQTAEGVHGLSIVHNPRNGNSTDSPTPSKSSQSKKRVMKVWKDGSLAYFPGIPNHNPNAGINHTNHGGKRGKVTHLSRASRKNMMLFLAKMKRSAEGYTCALTLPGEFGAIPPQSVHACFQIMSNRFTASGLFPAVSIIWKRELQKRGALHYHLLLYGIENESTRNAVHRWIAHQWNELIGSYFADEEKAKHLRWHLNRKNMEKVRGNMASYFAKYLGKAEEEEHAFIPGRWWGKVNQKALPLSQCSELELPLRAAIIAQRIARKIKQKRADEARHLMISKKCGLMDFKGNPLHSQFRVLAMKRGHAETPLEAAIVCHIPKLKGFRWGKAKCHGTARFAAVNLISNISPKTALQIAMHVGERFAAWQATNPF